MYVVYSKSKIHGVYDNKYIANSVRNFLEEKGGYNNGVPKRFYYIDEIDMNKLPKGMVI